MERKTKYDLFAARERDTTRLYSLKRSSERSDFQRDRDRILYSKEFRRLADKTQVFVNGFDDNTRNRLTHTIEVSQIACSIARSLGLNTELTEAIALGHDVGHTPFGHIGERVLNLAMNGCIPFFGFNEELPETMKGFKHNLQGVRVVSSLETHTKYEPGLNLTRYTMWGIANHTSISWNACKFCKSEKCQYKFKNHLSTSKLHDCKGLLSVGFYDDTIFQSDLINDARDWSFEAIIVGLADEIAQRHHDVEDGIHAGVLDENDIFDKIKDAMRSDEKTTLKKAINRKNSFDRKSIILSCISHSIVDLYVNEVLCEAKKVFEDLLRVFSGLKGHSDFFSQKKDIYDYLKRNNEIRSAISFRNNFSVFHEAFKEYTSSHVLYSDLAQSMDGKASFIVRQLLKAYTTNPQQLPDLTVSRFVSTNMENDLDGFDPPYARKRLNEEMSNSEIKVKLLRTICDFIAGMTDSYAYKQYNKLYGTKLE